MPTPLSVAGRAGWRNGSGDGIPTSGLSERFGNVVPGFGVVVSPEISGARRLNKRTPC